MGGVWSTQLDYVFFFYGLAFLLLGAVCLSIRERGHNLLLLLRADKGLLTFQV